jgi:hypothetical protein
VLQIRCIERPRQTFGPNCFVPNAEARTNDLEDVRDGTAKFPYAGGNSPTAFISPTSSILTRQRDPELPVTIVRADRTKFAVSDEHAEHRSSIWCTSPDYCTLGVMRRG